MFADCLKQDVAVNKFYKGLWDNPYFSCDPGLGGDVLISTLMIFLQLQKKSVSEITN